MIFAFEHVDDSLDLVPLAARRALDAAGCKLSLKAWRRLPVRARHAIVDEGAADVVDAEAVRDRLARHKAPFDQLRPIPDPSASAIPVNLTIALGHEIALSTWRALTPLERWALAKVAAKDHMGSERLVQAYKEMVVVHDPPAGEPLVSTHVNRRGEVHMVDVGAKQKTARRAVAKARVAMQPATAATLRAGGAAKGDVLATARIAGIQAAKRTPELVPLCHAIALTRVELDLEVEPAGVSIVATAEAHDRTGVEMEAMVAASAAALTVYDMLKGVDRGMTFDVALVEKSGGRSGTWRRQG